MKLLSTCRLALAIGIMVGSVPALPHHSFAMFDKEKISRIEGVVSRWAWTNPHVIIDVNVPDKQGGTKRYRIESASINILMREGWKVGAIKGGDRIKIKFNPLRNGKPGGLLIEAELPNGKTLKG